MLKIRLKKPVVVGTKIYLRFPETYDQKEFIALNRASKRFHRGLASPPTQVGEFHALLKRCRNDDFICFLVCRIEDGAIAGAINLSQRIPKRVSRLLRRR